jgi:endo-1,4-beta-xylanase
MCQKTQVQNTGNEAMDFNLQTRRAILAGSASFLLSACGGGGATRSPVTVSPPPSPPPPPPPPPAAFVPSDGAFKNAFQNKFVVGAAIGTAEVASGSTEAAILQAQFNSITAENVMKPATLAPTKGNYDFSAADALIAFAEANNIQIRGHALLWHRATPDYFFEGTPAEVRQNLEDYITAVVTHFKDKIYAWDVVNEVVSDSDGGTAPYRDSNWYQAAGGPDYIDWAFQAARAADPNTLLFINDYNTELSGKRGRLLDVVTDLVNRNIPLDGVGHQAHIQAATPAADVLAAVDAVDNQFMGLENHITELDISIYNDPGSCFENQTGCASDYGDNIPQSVIDDQAEKYRTLFNGFADRSSITSVTTWGLADGQSWLNGYPVTRTNAPLLYDRNLDAKKALQAIIEPDFDI